MQPRCFDQEGTCDKLYCKGFTVAWDFSQVNKHMFQSFTIPTLFSPHLRILISQFSTSPLSMLHQILTPALHQTWYPWVHELKCRLIRPGVESSECRAQDPKLQRLHKRQHSRTNQLELFRHVESRVQIASSQCPFRFSSKPHRIPVQRTFYTRIEWWLFGSVSAIPLCQSSRLHMPLSLHHVCKTRPAQFHNRSATQHCTNTVTSFIPSNTCLFFSSQGRFDKTKSQV